MKKLIIILAMLLMLSVAVLAGPGGSTIVREVTPDSASPNEVFTVRITATKGTEDMAGIIKEVKPSSFTFYQPTTWTSTFDSKTEDYYNNNLDIPFTESGTSGYYEYKLQAGTTSGLLTGNMIWEDMTNEDLGTICLKVNNQNCDGTPTPYCGDGTCDSDETCSTCSLDCGACSGGTSTSKDNTMLYVIIGIVVLVIIVIMFQKK